MPPTRTLTVLTGLVLTALIAGCTPRSGVPVANSAPPGLHPLPVTTTAPPTRPHTSTAPVLHVPTTPATRRTAAAGDLSITLAGGCVWYVDVTNVVWVAPTLQAHWTGVTPFPHNAFTMTSNYGKHTASGPVTNAAPFSHSIDATGFLGFTVTLTVTIDPGNDVPETNESNNILHISVIVPSSGYTTDFTPVPCTAV